ncbi:MAG: hypothetical protein IJ639_03265 [Ruminococcus sp.]|nr:hypothetical protein [Ruminococcus sp.]
MQHTINECHPVDLNHDGIKEFLKNDFALQREQKTLPVIIESGSGELEEQLYLLMKRNAESKQIELEKAS